jgi:hypothetical protein
MSSNFPPGYSEDGDAITHGRDSAMYQELCPIKEKFDKWAEAFGKEFFSVTMEQDVANVGILLEHIAHELNQPL